jgi:hypothetical protein
MNFDANAWRDLFERARVSQDVNLVHALIDELVAVYGSAAANKSDIEPYWRGQ